MLFGDKNGFLIRDDARVDYLNAIVDGDYAENHMNKCIVPLPDGKKAKLVSSGFIEGLSETAVGFTFPCAGENEKRYCRVQ